MGTLSYAATISLDGYIADGKDDIQWAPPNDDVFVLHLQRLANVSTSIVGRRTYGRMQHWETTPDEAEASTAELEFAQRWQAIEKVVVSSSLAARHLRSDRARLLRELGLADIRRILAATDGVVEIFGPTLASEALRAGMVDRFEFIVLPLVMGSGRRALPEGAYRKLKLSQRCMLINGAVYLQYMR